MLQRIAQKKLPMRNAAWTIYGAELVLFDGVYSFIKNKNRESD